MIGAGATRGASFVDPLRDPCLPPLDSDFFTQLQRIRNPKHKHLVDRVITDVVELFGQNFDVTMESVFTTLEHTIRMLQTTGDNRAFKKAELIKKRVRLEQAIAALLEESLTESMESGAATHFRKQCKNHDALVSDYFRCNDDIVSFNYDCILDDSLKSNGSGKWNPRYGYGFELGPRGKHLTGDEHWCPTLPADKDTTLHLYKLHGSLHLQAATTTPKPRVHLKKHPYTKRHGNLNFTIIPPEWHKAYDQGIFTKLWKDAATAVNKAREMVFIGYSRPPTDLHATALFRTAIGIGRLKSLVIVNPDREARHRVRRVLSRGLNKSTRVHSVDRLDQFVAASRDAWDI